MTSADILVIVLCVVVVAAVAAGVLIRKIKGKPSGCCSDCTRCGAECPTRAARDAQNAKTNPTDVPRAEDKAQRATHVCAHGCDGCRGCAGCNTRASDDAAHGKRRQSVP